MIRSSLVLSLLTLLSCSSSPTYQDSQLSLTEVRKLFDRHWNKTNKKVTVLDVSKMREGIFLAHGIVDQHPIEEYYYGSKNIFSQTPPDAEGFILPAEKPILYTDQAFEMAKTLAASLPQGAFVSILEVTDFANQKTALGQSLTTQLEKGCIQAGLRVVEREKLEKLLTEHRLQQNDSALFSIANLALIGQFTGSQFLIVSSYQIVADEWLQFMAKAISISTTQVMGIQEEKIPLTGPGANNKKLIEALLMERYPNPATPKTSPNP